MNDEKGLSGRGAFALIIISFALLAWYLFQRDGNVGIFRVGTNISENTNTQANDEQIGTVLGSQTTAACDARPQTSYGSCGYFLGVFFDGNSCKPVYGCSLNGDAPPFFDMGSCQQMCTNS